MTEPIDFGKHLHRSRERKAGGKIEINLECWNSSLGIFFCTEILKHQEFNFLKSFKKPFLTGGDQTVYFENYKRYA